MTLRPYDWLAPEEPPREPPSRRDQNIVLLMLGTAVVLVLSVIALAVLWGVHQ